MELAGGSTCLKKLVLRPSHPQPIEIKHDWSYGCNGGIIDCSQLQEHCIGLCQSPSYRSGREIRLYLSLNYLPLDWKSIRQIILKSISPTKMQDLEPNAKWLRCSRS